MTREILTPEQVDALQEFCGAIARGDEVVTNLVFSDESRFEKAPDNSWRRMKRGPWKFMQDGAPSHLSENTMAWLRERRVAVWPGWPENSPDLNPIENLWALMKGKRKKMTGTTGMIR